MMTDRSNVADVYPLSPLQEGLLFHSLLEPESDAYTEQLSATLAGELDADALKAAWVRLVADHAVLRTAIEWEIRDQPFQVVLRETDLPWRHEDWRNVPEATLRSRLDALRRSERSSTFDLSRPPLLRLVLVRTGERRHEMIWTFHHVLLDGWSVALLLDRLLALFRAGLVGRAPEPVAAPTFKEYVRWIGSQGTSGAEPFWRRYLAGVKAPTPLPAPRPGGAPVAGSRPEPESSRLALTAGETANLQAFAQRNRVTLGTVVLGAWALALARSTGRDDVVFGNTVSGRGGDLPGIASVVGLLINTLPVRVRTASGGQLGDWLREIQAEQAEARQHEHTPLVRIQEWSDVPRGVPLFESLLAFENYPSEELLAARSSTGAELEVASVRVVEQPHYPVALVVAPGERLSLRLLRDPALIDGAAARRLLGRVASLLAQMASGEGKRLEDLDALERWEHHRLLTEWADGGGGGEPELPVHLMVRERAAESPDALAVVSTDGCLSYGELARRAERLAARLRSVGVGTDDTVGIVAARSPAMVVGALATLEAGAAYLTLEPDHPPARLRAILGDARPAALLVEEGREGMPGAAGHTVVTLTAGPLPEGDGSRAPESTAPPLESAAYLVYTSGSSGRPKGVVLRHAGLASLVRWHLKSYDLGPEDRSAHAAGLGFDAAVWELWPPLVSGGSLHLSESADRESPGRLAAWLARERITVAFLVTPLAEALLAGGEPDGLALRLLLTGGDRLGRRPPAGCSFALVNHYGPSEGTVVATADPVPAIGDGAPSIGRPVAGVRTQIVSPSGELVPVGAEGEIWIGGRALARGYLGDPSLTAAAFVPDPWSGVAGARLYRTGDRARHRDDGRIEFLGRIDQQVEVRGVRVEPGEIEHVLLAHPEVGAALVVQEAGEDGGRLIAYVVPADGGTIPPTTELASFLLDRLPVAMVPAVFVPLAELPLTANGKVDRRRLPSPEAAAERRRAQAPRTPVERLVADAWQQVLQSGPVGPDDDFFALGGHSLTATRIVSRIRSSLSVEMPVRTLFEERTVSGLAAWIEEALRAGVRPEGPPLERLARDGDAPLSYSQQRLWFLDRLQPDSPVYNIPLAVRIEGELRLAVLGAALTFEVERQESLRTTFAERGGEPVQVVLPPSDLALSMVDLSALPDGPRVAEALLAAEARRPFDLLDGAPARALLLRTGEREHVLLLTLHHIVADGWSMTVLMRDLVALYCARAEDRPSPLPRLGVQYRDYAVWQRRWLAAGALDRQLAYWRRRMEGAPPSLDLPSDRPRPPVQDLTGARQPFRLGPEATEALRAFCRAEGATPFIAVLAAFEAMLSRITGAEDVVVGSLVANRTRTETEPLIGFFVNTQVLRTDLSGDPRFRTLVRRVRTTVLEAFSHQDLPFEELVAALAPPRDLSRTPLFQIAFTLQEPVAEGLELPGARLSPVEVAGATSRFDLGVDLVEEADAITGAFEYASALFDRTTVARLAARLAEVLETGLADPARRLSDLDVLSRAERHQIAHEWNDTDAPGHLEGCLHELLEELAHDHPDRVAVELAGMPLSYGELDRRANRLARYLRSRGVGRGVRVGLSIGRSTEMLVGLWAIFKSGGVYVPLDPGYPAERLAHIVEDSRVRLLLTHGERMLLPAGAAGADVVRIEDLARELATFPDHAPVTRVDPWDLAYVIYTSGSSGQPKGVLVSHRGLANLVRAQRTAFGLGPEARVLQLASLSFDFSLMEIALPLSSGARSIVAGDDALTGERGLEGFLAAHAVDTAVVPPTLLSTVSADRLPELTTLAVGGEAVGAEIVARWAPGRRFYNVYGPTESTVWTHVSPWSAGSCRPPIGRPIENVRTYTVDRRLRLLPVGVPGELLIGGEALAWGYLDRAALTAERFLPDPTGHRPGARVYRTGDLVRFLPDGELDFLGRIDHQVKVRGFRIEPGEIETVLSRHPSVLEAVVLAPEDGHGGRRLVAYLAVERPDRLDSAELRALVRDHLPEHMMPSAFVPLVAMPRTPNGKIDREALASTAAPPPAAGPRVPPRTATERALVHVWEEVLGHDPVGVDQNFFELGGDSILSLRVVARAAEAGLAITARHVFEHQTVAELARVAVPLAETGDPAPLVGPVPLTPIQHWFFEQELETPRHWNQALMLEVRDGLGPAVVARALDLLACRHDALRLRFHRDEATVRQVSQAPGAAAFALSGIDLAGVAGPLRARAVERAAETLQSSFDLERGPICAAAWLDLGAGRPAHLLLVVHHLAIDAVSWRILVEDLETACRALLGGEPMRLPPRTMTLRDWAERLEEHAAAPETLAELDFWAAPERLEVTPLRRDLTGGGNRVESSESVTVSFGADTALLMGEVRRHAHARVEELLLAALAHALGRILGRGLLPVDVEGHGREEISGANPSRTVGWFTTLYPLLLDTRAADPTAALRAVKERFRDVPRRGIGYGLLRHLTPDPEIRARLAALPQAEVSFNYLGVLDPGDGEQEALFRPSAEPTGPAQGPANRRHHLIEVGAVIAGGDLELTVRYGREIHRRDTVEALAEEMLAGLRSFVHSARAGTLSVPVPSDFPLAALASAELDRLIEVHGRIDDVYPLSPLQQGLLFHSRLESGAGEYVVQMGCRLSGELDAESLERAWEIALDRHPALRTAFVGWELDTGPRQVVLRRVELPFAREDWSALAEEERTARWSARLADDRRAGFDVERAPLLRLFLARVGEREHRLLATFHHLLLDGWSLAQLVAEVMEDYETLRCGGTPARPAPRPYRDYVAWLARRNAAQDEAYWRRLVAGLSAPTPLPRPRTGGAAAGRATRGEHTVRIPPAASDALRAAAARHRLTVATLLKGAFALLLGRLSGEPEVVFGVTTSGRPAELPGVESMVGLFINSLPARVPLPDGEPLLAWLRGVQARQAELRQHEATPLVAIHGWSEVPRDRPLFESLFVYESYPVPGSLDAAPGGLEVREIEVVERTHYPLTVVVAPSDALHVKLLYAGDRFDAAGALRLVQRFRRLAERLPSLLEDPATTLADLDSLTAGERHQVLHEWNDTRIEYPDDAPVHVLFEARAARHPDAVALVAGGQALTYGELDRRADDLARRLRARGVEPEERVGLLMERSVRTVVALLGVLKAGGAYVPLDPEWPEARLALVLDQVPVVLILTEGGADGRLPGRPEAVLRLDEPAEGPAAGTPAPVSSGHLAYVLFTSGSTGTPKGVAVCHRSIVRLIRGADYVSLRPDDAFLHFAPLGFDASTFEIWGALLTGARLVIAPPDGPSLAVLGDDLVRQRVTVLWLTAGLFHLMVEERPETLSGVRELLAGGDVLSAEHVRRALAARPGGRVINGYGPTEGTTFTCCHPMRDAAAVDGSVSIGRPIANTRVHLLDDGGRPVPAGCAGELHVGGPGLARGYLGDPALTAEKFVPDPLAAASGERLYRTGDLARQRSDGRIEFLGRRDLLVKVRGFRVEPGEVESALGRQPSVRESVVIAHRGGPGGARLVAYVVVEPGEEPSAAALRESLEAWLPAYMVPSAFVFLDQLPLDANGKVDRRALPVPEVAGEADFVTARTPTEELLVNLWREVLEVERIGVHDGFFDLGGHSLLAARLLARVQEAFGVQVPIRGLFEQPTVAGLAILVEDARRDGVVGQPPIAQVPRDVDLMLSFSQERLWFLDQLEPGSPLYNIPVALRLTGGRPDHRALRRSLEWVVGRHESLRTTFDESRGRPLQRISRLSGWRLPLVDLSQLAPGEREAEARRLAGQQALEPFDLGHFPLLRTHLLRLSEEEHVLLVVIHHIVADGGSMQVLVDELADGYGAFAAGDRPERPELVVQYPDFAQWQRRYLRGEILEGLLSYWRERLEGAPAMLELATDRPRPVRQRFRGAARDAELPSASVERLDAFARRTGTTAFMVLLAAFQGLLARSTGQRDFVVGTPVANRSRPEIQSLIGFFVNTLALRADLRDRPGFGALVRRVRETVLGAFAHEDLPFETLVEELRPERDLSHAPLFQVMFAMRQDSAPGARRLPGLTFEAVAVPAATAKFDLTLELVVSDRQVYGRWEYDVDLFDATTIQRMAGAFETFLAGALEAPERPYGELPILSRAERHQVAHEWNDTWSAFPEALTFHARVAEHARRRPDAVALDFEDRAVTYGELDARSDRLARYLLRLGVEPGSRVGIGLERSPELGVAILGILKAGSAYLPLDPTYPQVRLDLMVDDARLAALISQESLIDTFPEPDGPVVSLDYDRDAIAAEPAEPCAVRTSSGSPAYLIYTSGSTGRPKGALLTHRGLSNLVEAQTREFGLAPSDRVLQFAALSFDASVFDFAMALGSGATLQLAPDETLLPGPDLIDFLRSRRVGHVTLPPSALEVLPGDELPDLRRLVVAGEACSSELSSRWSEGRRFWNAYGPTEATIWSTVFECRPDGRRPPIGRPILNSAARVLDDRLGMAPIGVAGELYLAGAGLGLGYLERPALTAERFLPDPLGGELGGRLYRTGDRVRHLVAGELEFLGRVDHQVKVRGFRIELGEIESALEQHPRVARAIVLLRAPAGGHERLVAYVVPVRPEGERSEDNGAPSGPAADAPVLETAELAFFLRQRLPGFMMPQGFVLLDSLPLTPSGKVDRAALPAPEDARSGRLVAPRTAVEEVLAGIWADLLKLDTVGVYDNFFELGGHSLIATQMVSRVREAFRIELPLRGLFEAATVAALAEKVEEALGLGRTAEVPPIRPVAREGGARLSYPQQRLWFLDQLEPGSAAYAVLSILRMDGPLRVTALAGAMAEIVRRHEILRTNFVFEGDEPRQVVSPAGGARLPLVDLAGLSEAARRDEVRRLAQREGRRPFDLVRDRLIRMTLLAIGAEEHVALLAMHHIVSDGWSTDVLAAELAVAYRALAEGRTVALPDLPVQYGDYAEWQRSWLSGEALEEHLRYWVEKLADRPALPAGIPPDRPRPRQPTRRGERIVFTVGEEITKALEELCRREGVTLFMVLLAVLDVLVYRTTGEEDVLIGAHVANRNRAEIEGLIGFFVNILVLRNSLTGGLTFLECLRRVRRTTLEAYAHQDLPYDRLVEELQPRRDASHNPLFQVAFNFTGRSGAAEAKDPDDVDDTPFRVTVVEPEESRVRFDFMLAMSQEADRLSGSWEYAAELYDRSTAERVHRRYLALLEDIARRPDARLDELEPGPAPADDEARDDALGDRAEEYERFRTVRPKKVRAGGA